MLEIVLCVVLIRTDFFIQIVNEGLLLSTTVLALLLESIFDNLRFSSFFCGGLLGSIVLANQRGDCGVLLW
jgi:hypothetical protein